jgi:penicillin-binding protein 2
MVTYNKKKNKIVRRVLLIGSFKFIIFFTIISRLYKLQVINRDKYKTLSEKNRINLILHAPIRGKILDSTGNILADNKRVYTLTISNLNSKSIKSTLFSLKKLITLSNAEIDLFYKKIQNPNYANKNVSLKEYLSWKELSIIYVNISDLPGANIKVSSIREYSMGSYYAHTLGYTSLFRDSNDAYSYSSKIPSLPVGKTGIEKVYDSFLRGIPGTEQVEVNAQGKKVRRLNIIKSVPGNNVQLTINSEMQDFTHRVIGSNIGAALVLDAKNGNIISSASSPSYDPNIFSKTLNKISWKNIMNASDAPLLNRPIKGLYPPGSTFKPVVALAALKHGLISSSDKIFCNGTYALGNRNFHCWKKGGHGNLNLIDGIAQSCDVYFYELALRLGIDKISEAAKKLGFGNYYDDFFGESKSIIPNKKWKKNKYAESWQKGESLNVGIGQGFLLTTPLELAIMTANIINKGAIIKPNILKSITNKKIEKQILENEDYFNNKHLEIIKKGMYKVLNSPKGTAWKSRVKDKDFIIAGKTGTSQVRIISVEERATGIIKNDDLPFKKRDHALFIGFAPYNNPKYVTTVILEHAGGGASKAAPIARKLLIKSRKVIEGIDTNNIVS